jgi:hypothetical protein
MIMTTNCVKESTDYYESMEGNNLKWFGELWNLHGRKDI